MNIVNAPLTRTDRSSALSATATVRAMEVGQHVMAGLLTTIGGIRAVGDGTPPAAAIAAGLGILAWHTVGTILPSRLRSQRHILLWLLGLAVVWAAAVAVSAEFVWVAFLLWLLAGHTLPGLWAVAFSAAVYALVAVAPLLHHGTTSYANVFGPLIGGVFALGISRGYLQLLREASEREQLVASLTRAQEEMAQLQDELAAAGRHAGEIAERTRLSRDIHDTVAQSLSSLRLIAHAAGARAEEASTRQTLSQIETLAGEGQADIRRIIAALAPAALDDDALAAALGRLLGRLAAETDLETALHADDTLPTLPMEVEVALLRTAQSALANVRLHASASRVVVSLIDADDAVRLDVIDDGIGFDAADWERRSPNSASGYGLGFMRDRLRELGGGLEIEAAPGDGTAVSAHLPIHIRHKESS